jgi:hypothetical protein
MVGSVRLLHVFIQAIKLALKVLARHGELVVIELTCGRVRLREEAALLGFDPIDHVV